MLVVCYVYGTDITIFVGVTEYNDHCRWCIRYCKCIIMDYCFLIYFYTQYSQWLCGLGKHLPHNLLLLSNRPSQL